jgi:hypothetical protein
MHPVVDDGWDRPSPALNLVVSDDDDEAAVVAPGLGITCRLTEFGGG